MKELMTTPKIDRMEAKSRPMVVMGKYSPYPIEVIVIKVYHKQVA